MRSYRLVYRASHREANSTFTNPRFRLQLPENVLNDGTNKQVEVVLEHFSGYIAKDASALDDAVVVKMRQPAVNSVQTSGAGVFEGGNVLGIATLTAQHTNEHFITTQYSSNDCGLKYQSAIFNQGFLEFSIEHLDGTPVGIPSTVAFREYNIILCIKCEDYQK